MARSKILNARDEVVKAAEQFVFNNMTWSDRQALIEAVIALRSLEAIAGGQGPSVAGAPDTSWLAGTSVTNETLSLRRRTLIAVATRRDQLMSDEMLERELRMKHQTLSSARNWLVENGWLEDSCQRAVNSSGRKAVLWTLTREARLAMA